jgi:antitoxin VapB
MSMVEWYTIYGTEVPLMAMNIKSEEAQKLARQLSEITGESLTTAVTEAVRERLERVKSSKGEGLADRLLKIGRECAARLKEPYRSVDHGDILYDEKGLPR